MGVELREISPTSRRNVPPILLLDGRDYVIAERLRSRGARVSVPSVLGHLGVAIVGKAKSLLFLKVLESLVHAVLHPFADFCWPHRDHSAGGEGDELFDFGFSLASACRTQAGIHLVEGR